MVSCAYPFFPLLPAVYLASRVYAAQVQIGNTFLIGLDIPLLGQEFFGGQYQPFDVPTIYLQSIGRYTFCRTANRSSEIETPRPQGKAGQWDIRREQIRPCLHSATRRA